MNDPLPELPFATSVFFGAIVLAVLVAIAAGVWHTADRLGFPRGGSRRLATDVTLALIAWLALTAFLANSGILLQFEALPPRIMFVLVPALIAVFVVGTAPKFSPFLLAVPLAWIIGLQTFRLPLEIVLWQLHRAGVIAPLMTFEGRNFDILIGATAPVVAALYAKGRISLRWVGWWNVAGLLLLANVVLHGLLSAPTPFQQIQTQPPTTFVARWPYVWLVALLVPLALFLHIVALRILGVEKTRQLRAERTDSVTR
jgi:hypothetical protein